MARIRSIKPGFFMNDELHQLGPYAALLFAGLWTLADNQGRLEDRPLRIKAAVLPYYNIEIEPLLSALHDAGFIERYEGDECRLIWVTGFREHQRITGSEADSNSKYPAAPSDNPEETPRNQQGNTEETPRITGREGKGKDRKGKDREDAGASAARPKKVFVKPDKEAIAEFFRLNEGQVAEARKFFDHYESNGWKVGRNPMVDWQASARNWITGRFTQGGSRASPNSNGSAIDFLAEQDRLLRESRQ